MKQMHHIIVSFGSNNNWRENKWQAIRLVRALVVNPVFTPTLRSKDIYGSKKVYSNCLMDALTEQPLKTLCRKLKCIETSCGNTVSKRNHGVVDLDLDLLLYDSQRLHHLDWDRPYIIKLLRELENRKEHQR